MKIRQILLFMIGAIALPAVLAIFKHLLGIETVISSLIFSFEGALVYFSAVTLMLVIMLMQLENAREKSSAVLGTEAKFQAIFENSYDAISLLDKTGKILYSTPSTIRVVGYKPEELAGQSVFALVYPDDLATTQQKFSELIAKPGSTINVEYRILHKDSSIRWLEGMGTNLLEDPKIQAIVANYRDITSRKMADLMKKDFISLVSHQLKTPIAQLKGFIENMLHGITGELNEKQREYLASMLEITTRNYKMISDLLNISRIERGVITFEKHPWKLKDITEQLKTDYQDAVTKKGLQFIFGPVDEAVEIFADREKLLEAIGNIIMNAIKFTISGSISVTTGTAGNFVYLEVADTGPGMSEEVLKKLFTSDQVLAGSASVEKGAGLGLYIAKQFLLLQGGDIKVKSVEGKGSTFSVAIPKNVYNLNKDYVRTA